MISSTLTHLIEWTQWLFLFYFLGLNTLYLSLNVVAAFVIRNAGDGRIDNLMPTFSAGMEPGISVIVPAYNEEANISISIHSMMQLNYPDFEIVIVNDGSKDKTLAVLIAEFEFKEFPAAYHLAIDVKPVKAVYRSIRYPQLVLIDKANGGKADAVNAGINMAKHALFCAVDADSILDVNALRGVAAPFMEDRSVIAVGGMVRIANGSHIVRGYLQKVAMAENWIARLQVIEYLRAFLFGRLGWTPTNSLLIISGAFGLFRRTTVIEVSGYRHTAIGEDMDLVIRLHGHMREQKIPYKVVYVPRPICWTEAPETLKVLRGQRIRWQRGLLDSLWESRHLMFKRGSGAVGWLSIPLFLIFEACGPLLEAIGVLVLLISVLTGLLSLPAFIILMAATLTMGFLLSASALLMEESHFNLYPKPKDLLIMIGMVFIENLGYRQLNAWWRVVGTYRWLTRAPNTWGDMPRKGLGNR